MRRKIITIDEEKCTGCGECIPDCPEGALQIIEGKARLVSDLFCDGLGACIGTCPEGAISVIEREAEPYDEKAVMAKIVPQGQAVIRAHLEHLVGHGETALYRQALEYLVEIGIPVPEHRSGLAGTTPGGPRQGSVCPPGECPGAAARSIERGPSAEVGPKGHHPVSELRQWPVQLRLLNPGAAYFDNADLLIAADCVPVARAGFHREFLRGRVAIIFCPKLDADLDDYVERLAAILSRHEIRSITVLRMEVPCCTGTRAVVDRAIARSGKTIPIVEETISIQGEVL
ncbi:Electron transport complex subunit RsxB [anaerobic digester metagenome]